MGCVSIVLTKQQIHPNQTPSVSWSTQTHSFFFFCPLQSSLAPWSSTLNSPHVTEISQSLLHAPFNHTHQSINSRKQEYLGEQVVPFDIQNHTQKNFLIMMTADGCATNIQFPGGDGCVTKIQFPNDDGCTTILQFPDDDDDDRCATNLPWSMRVSRSLQLRSWTDCEWASEGCYSLHGPKKSCLWVSVLVLCLHTDMEKILGLLGDEWAAKSIMAHDKQSCSGKV